MGDQRENIAPQPCLYSIITVVIAVVSLLAALLCAPGRSVAAGVAAFSAAAPSGFDALLGPQTAMVDVYYGGRRVGTAMAEYQPDRIRFLNPVDVARLVPRLNRPDEVRAALEPSLPSHADRACADEANGRCRRLEPELVGVIFDEARFRTDLFVNPAYLDVDTPLTSRYIPVPDAIPSVATSLSGVVSGGSSGAATYGVQGRAVASLGPAHLAIEATQSSDLGFQVQTISLAVDHGRFRAQAGLLVTPGVDLIGQGRFYGAGFSTQTDTLANRDLISATPLQIYLANRAQVDVLCNGRLLASRLYDAGNQLIDTSGLPDGAYTVTLRVRELNGFTHEETRQFNKSRTLPPLGLPQFFIGAGVLAQDYGAGLPKASGALFEAGYARRLNAAAAFDLTAAYAGRRVLAEAGFTYLAASGLRLRTAALGSDDGGYGVLFTSALTLGQSSVFTIDARQRWGGRDLRPLVLALPNGLAEPYQQNQFGVGLAGSQISGSYNFAWRGAQFGLLGSYTAAPFSKSSHSFGPTADIPIRITGVDLRFVANVAETERGVQGFLGFRMQFNRGRAAVYGSAGAASATDGSGRSTFGPAADVTASFSRSDEQWGEADISANLDHTQDRDTAALAGQLHGDRGDFSLQLDHDLSGQDQATHYSASFLIGAAATPTHMAVGGASGGDSGVIVSVKGAPKAAEFEVMIDGSARARLHAGESLSLMLPPYRVYAVRLTPRGATMTDFDTAERLVSLYPGTVKPLTWRAEQVVEVFGRALDELGQPVSNAVIQGARTVGWTDDNGYFQVELSQDGKLRFDSSGRGRCDIAVNGVAAARGHLSLGARRCYAMTFANRDDTLKIAAASNARRP